MSNHTPAPWHINKTFKTELEIWSAGTPKVAIVPDTNVSINEQAANANLISAAPDLLAALTAAVIHIERMNASASAFDATPASELEFMEAALAKATGK